MSGFTVYVITRLDIICRVFEPMAVLSGFALAAAIVWYFAEGQECLTFDEKYNRDGDESHFNQLRKRWLKWRNYFIFSFIFSIAGLVLIPTTKEAAAIIVTPKVLTNTRIEQFGEFGDNLMTLATQWSRNMIEKAPVPATESNTENK